MYFNIVMFLVANHYLFKVLRRNPIRSSGESRDGNELWGEGCLIAIKFV